MKHLLRLFLAFFCGSVYAQASFTSPTTTTWTVPPCVTSITVQVWGAGGGGGGSNAVTKNSGAETCTGAGGGGGGGFCSTVNLAVTPGQVFNIVVGGGGTGGVGGTGKASSGVTANATNGNPGGLSSFSNIGLGVNLIANGGTGGGLAQAYNTGGNGTCALSMGVKGTGGTASGGGTYNFTGGDGAAGFIANLGIDKSAGGGGAAGPGGNGGNAPTVSAAPTANPAGGTGKAPGGNGGDGWYLNVASTNKKTGNNGKSYGGGAGGGLVHQEYSANTTGAPGGNGADGAVIITYTPNTPPVSPTIAGKTVCAGAPVTLNVTAPATGDFDWYDSPSGGTLLYTGSSLTATLPSTTTAYIETRVSGCVSSSRTAVTVTVNPIPIAPGATYNSPVCIGSIITLKASNVAGASYHWTGPNGFTSNIQNPTRILGSNLDEGDYQVTAIVNGCPSPLVTVKVTACPLPIEYLSFEGSANGSTNVLKWVTATEKNNSHFIIERSKDGLIFEDLGRKNASTKIYGPHSYDYLDSQPWENTYYRLRQYDIDGTFSYSHVVLIKRENTEITSYFNPQSNTLELYTPTEKNLQIKVLDIQGRLIQAYKPNVVFGSYVQSLDLSPSVYLIQILEQGNLIKTEKILVLK